MKFVIIIPTANRLELLSSCVNSILKNLDNISNYKIETLIGFNNDQDGYSRFIAEEKYKDLYIKKFLFSQMSPANIRNELVKKIESHYDYILFLDDDIILPKNYLLNSLNYLKNHSVSVLGGSDCCYPDAGEFEKMINYTIQSPLVTNATRIRHIVQKITKLTDESGVTLSNLWINAEVFLRKYRFNSNYFRNEENVLVDELFKDGHKIVHLSDLFVYHKRRNTLLDFWYPSFRSGQYRMKSLAENPNPKKIAFLVPLLFLYFNMFIVLSGNILFLIPLFIYVLGTFIYAFRVFYMTRKLSFLIGVFFLQSFLILIYAFGQFNYFLSSSDE